MRRERQRQGFSPDTQRAIANAIISAALEAAMRGVRDSYYDSSRSYKQHGAQRGRVTALRA
jgi:hypothetical protein